METLILALEECKKKFAYYAECHAAKGGGAKEADNRAMVNMIDSVLSAQIYAAQSDRNSDQIMAALRDSPDERSLYFSAKEMRMMLNIWDAERRNSKAWKAKAVVRLQAAQPAYQGFDAEFLSKRLARVAKMTGIPMPDMTHEQIAEVAGTILGQIASKLEAALPAHPVADQPEDKPDAYMLFDRNGEAFGYSPKSRPMRGLDWEPVYRVHTSPQPPKPAVQEAQPEMCQAIGIKRDGTMVVIPNIPLPAEMKAKEIVGSYFGHGYDDEDSEASMALECCKELIDWMRIYKIHKGP